MHPFIKNLFFIVEPLPQQIVAKGWGKPSALPPAIIETKPEIENEDEKKKLFGIEWAKLPDTPFEAACEVFEETKIALWVAKNWLNDPIVNANRDLYGETLKLNKPILDKEQLAAKVLQLAEAKTDDGLRYLIDAKDRIAAFKLYSEIAGYTGKVEIDASTKNFTTNNEMKVIFVKATPENQEKEIAPQDIKTIDNDNSSPVKIKLVK